ncbi:MAG: hypothetical protein R3B38_02770 [Patescibacteria group bacterium]
MIYLLVGILVVALAILWLFRSKPAKVSEQDKAKIRAAWDQINNLLDSTDDHAWAKAVMDADKVLDLAMAMVGAQGQGLGEKLKRNEQMLGDVNRVWNAHKLRNRLAHDVDVNITKPAAVEAVRTFEGVIRRIGLM